MADKYISVATFAEEMKKRQDAAGKWLREAKDHETAARADTVLSFLCEVKLTLDAIPAADVVERKRGEWVKARGSWFTPGGDPVWECSLCGKGRHVYGIEHGTYGADIADGQWVSCPNCGADMRGESDG